LKRHQDKQPCGSHCSCRDGHRAGVGQNNNPAAARIAGKCVARETLSLLKRSASPIVFQKLSGATRTHCCEFRRSRSSVRPDRSHAAAAVMVRLYLPSMLNA
jgi:hypothetical protein